MNKNIGRQFSRYVSQNIFGMIGISFYILADTFFISRAVGADGITALNLVLPIYSLIFAFGAMIGVGSAIRFSIASGQQDTSSDGFFTNAIFWGTIIGFVFGVAGFFFPDEIVRILGGDSGIVAVGSNYTRIFISFAPVFIWNHICNAFVRNDGNPSLAMTATLVSSIFNVVFDYVLMFPLGMGMDGAALATALSPLVGTAICMIHILSKKSRVKLKRIVPSLRKLVFCCKTGVSSFVGEISSGVITVVFNTIILHLAGNTGVAAYGVVANISMVAVAVFNGVSQGSQPLLSKCYGSGDAHGIRKLKTMSLMTALVLSVVIIACIYLWTENIANIFNKEHDALLTEYAIEGLRIYFTGFLFAGINIVGTGIFSAVDSVRWAFVTSILRGFVLIIICAFGLSAIWKMKGVWMAFPVAELLTMIVSLIGLHKIFHKDLDNIG